MPTRVYDNVDELPDMSYHGDNRTLPLGSSHSRSTSRRKVFENSSSTSPGKLGSSHKRLTTMVVKNLKKESSLRVFNIHKDNNEDEKSSRVGLLNSPTPIEDDPDFMSQSERELTELLNQPQTSPQTSLTQAEMNHHAEAAVAALQRARVFETGEGHASVSCSSSQTSTTHTISTRDASEKNITAAGNEWDWASNNDDWKNLSFKADDGFAEVITNLASDEHVQVLNDTSANNNKQHKSSRRVMSSRRLAKKNDISMASRNSDCQVSSKRLSAPLLGTVCDSAVVDPKARGLRRSKSNSDNEDSRERRSSSKSQRRNRRSLSNDSDDSHDGNRKSPSLRTGSRKSSSSSKGLSSSSQHKRSSSAKRSRSRKSSSRNSTSTSSSSHHKRSFSAKARPRHSRDKSLDHAAIPLSPASDHNKESSSSRQHQRYQRSRTMDLTSTNASPVEDTYTSMSHSFSGPTSAAVPKPKSRRSRTTDMNSTPAAPSSDHERTPKPRSRDRRSRTMDTSATGIGAALTLEEMIEVDVPKPKSSRNSRSRTIDMTTTPPPSSAHSGTEQAAPKPKSSRYPRSRTMDLTAPPPPPPPAAPGSASSRSLRKTRSRSVDHKADRTNPPPSPGTLASPNTRRGRKKNLSDHSAENSNNQRSKSSSARRRTQKSQDSHLSAAIAENAATTTTSTSSSSSSSRKVKSMRNVSGQHLPERLRNTIDRSTNETNHDSMLNRLALSVLVAEDEDDWKRMQGGDPKRSYSKAITAIPSHLLDPDNVPMTMHW